MTVLEDRYRAVLRLLPASYRAVWEQEMVSTFRDSTRTGDAESDELLDDFGRPGFTEVVSIVVLAARLRLTTPAAVASRAVCGQALRVVALVALLVNVVALPAAIAQYWWLTTGMPLPEATERALEAHPVGDPGADIDLFGVLWVAAFLFLLAGQYRAGKLLAVIALAPSVAVVLAMTVQDSDRPAVEVLARWGELLVYAAVVATVAAFVPSHPPPRRRPWLIALVLVLAVSPVVGVVPLFQPIDSIWLDWPGLLCLAWIAVAVVPRVHRSLPAAAAMILLGLPVVVLRLVWLAYFVALPAESESDGRLLITVAVAETLAVAAIEIVLMVRIIARFPPAMTSLPDPTDGSQSMNQPDGGPVPAPAVTDPAAPGDLTARPVRNRYAIPLTALIAGVYIPSTEQVQLMPTTAPPEALIGFDAAGDGDGD
ncbi:MAG TPA: hypothetical protein VIT42_07345 [Microlunatus sp.]